MKIEKWLKQPLEINNAILILFLTIVIAFFAAIIIMAFQYTDMQNQYVDATNNKNMCYRALEDK